VKAGASNWESLAVNDLGKECYATPAISGEKIFIRARNSLYCFGALSEGGWSEKMTQPRNLRRGQR